MTAIPEKDHASLGPSGWDRWSACPGSIVLSEGRPNPTSIYAAWGTVAHEIAAYCLNDDVDAESFVNEVFTVEEHRIEVDMEMADAVNDYIAQVRLFIPDGDPRMIEQEVPIGHLTGETGATGTADAIGIVNGGTRLVVIDAKFGKGVQVYACSIINSGRINGQGGMYALGALEKFGLVYDDIAEVEIVIVQPQLDHVNSIVVSLADLEAFGEEVRLAAGRVALAQAGFGNQDYNHQAPSAAPTVWAEDYLNPGEKQCKFCRAKAICPALKAEVEGAMQPFSGAADADEFEDLTLPKKAASLVPAVDVSNEQLAEAFRAIDLIEAWIGSIGAEVDRRLLEGQAIPGLYLGVGKAGRRQWADPKLAEAELKKRYKVDEMYNRQVISPTQAEKLIAKEKPRVWATIVQTVGILQPEGKPKVCREGVDKNKPYALPSPDDFDNLTAGESEPVAEKLSVQERMARLGRQAKAELSGLLDD